MGPKLVVPVLGRLRQDGLELETSLDCIEQDLASKKGE